MTRYMVFNWNKPNHPGKPIPTQIFLFELGLSLKLSSKAANFLKPIPL